MRLLPAFFRRDHAPMKGFKVQQPVDLYICVTCQPEADRAARPGKILYQNMLAELENHPSSFASSEGSPSARHPSVKPKDDGNGVRLHAVECLCVCKRPCTVAVSSPEKWTYIIAGLDPVSDVGALCQYLDVYAVSEFGTPPLSSRPAAIKNGTVARIPPGVPYAT